MIPLALLVLLASLADTQGSQALQVRRTAPLGADGPPTCRSHPLPQDCDVTTTTPFDGTGRTQEAQQHCWTAGSPYRLLGLLPPTGAGLQRWLEWDPGLDAGSVDTTEHRDGSVFLLEPLALTGFKDVCVSGGGDPALAMAEIGTEAKFYLKLGSVGIVPVQLQLLNSFGLVERDGYSGWLPAFGSSAVRARLGVLCRSSRWLRWDPGDRDGDSGRPHPFGPSAVRARLGVPCRLGRRLR